MFLVGVADEYNNSNQKLVSNYRCSKIILVKLISSFLQLLVALKVRYHQRITILRGNHESRQVLDLSFSSCKCCIPSGIIYPDIEKDCSNS